MATSRDDGTGWVSLNRDDELLIARATSAFFMSHGNQTKFTIRNIWWAVDASMPNSSGLKEGQPATAM